MTRKELKSVLFRITCPIVVYSYLLYLAVTAKNTKALFCLLGIVLLLGMGVWTIRRVQQVADQVATPANRETLLNMQLLLGKRLGACLCSVAFGVGVCFVWCPPARFLQISIPVLLSGTLAMFILGRRTEQKLMNHSVK